MKIYVRGVSPLILLMTIAVALAGKTKLGFSGVVVVNCGIF